MASNPIFPLYYNDLLGSTKTWTDEEFGAYMRLLIDQWDKGFIPKEFKRMNRIAESAELNWNILGEKFVETDGKLQNKKLEEIREKRKRFSEMQSEKGEKGGRGKAKQKPNAKPNAKPNNNQTKAHKKPKDIEIEIEKEIEIVKENRTELIYPFDSDEFLKWWAVWRVYKRIEHNFLYKSKISEQSALKKLSELSELSDLTAIKILDEAMAAGWQGFFKLKNNGNSKTGSKEFSITEMANGLAKYFGTEQPSNDTNPSG